MTDEKQKKPWLTTATKITIVRIALLPLIVFFYVVGTAFESAFFYQYGKLMALILFVIAAASDWLDGYVARHFNQVTDIGKLLDPIADKMLSLIGLVLIVSDPEILRFDISGGLANPNGLLPIWFAVVIIVVAMGRDFIVSYIRQLAADKGIIYSANWSGKIKTTFQYVGIVMIMFYAFDTAINNAVVPIGLPLDIYSYTCLFLMALVVILNIYTVYDYSIKYMQKVREKK